MEALKHGCAQESQEREVWGGGGGTPDYQNTRCWAIKTEQRIERGL